LFFRKQNPTYTWGPHLAKCWNHFFQESTKPTSIRRSLFSESILKSSSAQFTLHLQSSWLFEGGVLILSRIIFVSVHLLSMTFTCIYHPHWTQCNITSHPPRSLADSRFPRLGSHSRVLSTAPARTSWSITELFHAYNLDMFFFGKMGVYSIFRHIHMPVINYLIVIGCPSCKNSKNT